MLVKIIKAKLSTYWYADCIGEIFEVSDKLDSDGSYVILPIDGCTIDTEDCKVLSEND